MRGLKRIGAGRRLLPILSHLLQMRGLKHPKPTGKAPQDLVASFTDAWIETREPTKPLAPNTAASSKDTWIKTHP